MSGQATGKRSLPSWMSSRVNGNKNPSGNGDNEGTATTHKSRDSSKRSDKEGTPSKQSESTGSSSDNFNFSRLLEGVVFVLSGFVNPERSNLRSQALEMGAEYKPDWSSDCTLLVCAFPNTPKFRQVQDDCGTIVSKDWISGCYSQKKLVEIERYLMHAGRPWRRGNTLPDTKKDEKTTSVSRKSQKQTEAGSPSKPIATRKLNAAQNEDVDIARNCFSLSEVKKWAVDDFAKTMLWLQTQEEKPDPSEIRQIAVEGILTCLQDAISVLKQKQDVHEMTEEWNFVPHVVEELAKLDGAASNKSSMSKEDLCKWATDCKRIYEEELNNSNNELRHARENSKAKASSESGYDSDKTVVMTEEEIDLAYQAVASKISNCE